MEFFWIAVAAATAFLSGRDVIAWSFLVGFFGWIALIPLALLPKKMDKVQKRMQWIADKSDNLVIKQEGKDFNTVDDLFKQLEKA
jgi:hypothetical protein